MGPTGLREFNLSDLTRRSASLEIALQRRAGAGRHSAPPADPVGSSLQRLQVLKLQCVKVMVTVDVQAGNLSFLLQNQSVPAQVVWGVRPVQPLLHTASHRCVLGRPAPGSCQSIYQRCK